MTCSFFLRALLLEGTGLRFSTASSECFLIKFALSVLCCLLGRGCGMLIDVLLKGARCTEGR
jgi:hypothetical protein